MYGGCNSSEGISCLFVAAPRSFIASLVLNYRNLRFRACIMYFYNKIIHNNEARGVVGAIPHESMGCYIFIKHKNDMYEPAAPQNLAI